MIIIGAILTIIFFTGLVLIYISFIIAAAAFCIIKTKQPTTTPSASNNYTQQPPTTHTITIEAKYCPHCGAPVASGTAFCTQCGKQI
jgi:hypothetical protein